MRPSLLFHHFHRFIIHFYRSNLHEKSAITLKNKSCKVRRRWWKSLNEVIREILMMMKKVNTSAQKEVSFLSRTCPKNHVYFFLILCWLLIMSISRMNGGVFVCMHFLSFFSMNHSKKVFERYWNLRVGHLFNLNLNWPLPKFQEMSLIWFIAMHMCNFSKYSSEHF